MSDEIKIEKGVPVPPGRFTYPFATMEVGDSFWVEGRQVLSGITGAGRRFNAKFISRSEIKDGVAGTRVWRVE